MIAGRLVGGPFAAVRLLRFGALSFMNCRKVLLEDFWLFFTSRHLP